MESIRKDVWLEINDNLTALEKVKIINYIMFHVYRFGRPSSGGLYEPQDSYVNRVIETRTGNPITLGILYLSVTWRLGLPVFGVDLPGNFILAYQDAYRSSDTADSYGDVLFYINPYGKGAVLGRQEIEHFVDQQQLEPHPSFYEPCSNRITAGRLVRQLAHCYEKSGSLQKVQQLQELLSIILG